MKKLIEKLKEMLLETSVKITNDEDFKKTKKRIFLGRVASLVTFNVIALTNVIFAADILTDTFNSVIDTVANPIMGLVDEKIFVIAFAVIVVCAIIYLVQPNDRAAAKFSISLKNVLWCIVVIFCLGFVFDVIDQTTKENGLRFTE